MRMLNAAMLFQWLKGLPLLRGRPLVSARVGWTVAALVVTVWSALCAAAYGLVQLLGNWAVTAASYGAKWDVGVTEFVTAGLSLTQSVGHILVGGVWFIGALAILGLTWFLTKFRGVQADSPMRR